MLDVAVEVGDTAEIAAAVPSRADPVHGRLPRDHEVVPLGHGDVDDRGGIEDDRAAELAVAVGYRRPGAHPSGGALDAEAGVGFFLDARGVGDVAVYVVPAL